MTVVASVAGFRAVVRSARFAQTSCTGKQQTTASNVKIEQGFGTEKQREVSRLYI